MEHRDHMLTLTLKDGGTGWLGRQDSNLGMVESKSADFPCNINALSDKT